MSTGAVVDVGWTQAMFDALAAEESAAIKKLKQPFRIAGSFPSVQSGPPVEGTGNTGAAPCLTFPPNIRTVKL